MNNPFQNLGLGGLGLYGLLGNQQFGQYAMMQAQLQQNALAHKQTPAKPPAKCQGRDITDLVQVQPARRLLCRFTNATSDGPYRRRWY
jgi:hypothetical protein